jgi:DNA-binding transcriptional LysR family regulator
MSVQLASTIARNEVDNSVFKRYLWLAMDTRFLETFLMAVDNGSIAEAARRLNLTAAAVAKRIRALENEIGSALVTRSGRTIRPTEAGAAIVERARHFLIEARDFKSIAATGRPSGQLRLGAFQSALSGLVPDILALMKQKYPQIDVYITRGTSEELYRKVRDGDDLDAAIIAQPPFAIPKSCEWRLLREEPLIVLTRAPAGSRSAHAILASEPFIRFDHNLWPGRLVDSYLRKVGIRPREHFELDGFEAIAVMVDRGLGVSLLPDWAPPWPEGLSLAKLPVPDRSFPRRIGLVWARTSLRLSLVYAFLEQAAAARAQGPTGKTANSRARVRR